MTRRVGSAVVLGGGMSGILAAAVLASCADRVTVVESDRFPGEPRPRKGLPQGHHFHMFMGGGVDALEDVLPGVVGALAAAGAHRKMIGEELLVLSAEGWIRRFSGDAYVIAATRHLVDHVVREHVLADRRIEVLEGTKVLGLTGGPDRVTGVRVESGVDAGGERTLAADLVVDATGRSSRSPQWLRELGARTAPEEQQEAGFAYSGRLYQAPPGVGPDFPGLLIQPRPGTGLPGQGGALLPCERDTWIVAMIGTKGGQPPTDEPGFLDFARGLPHPLIADLLADATPLTDIRAYRGLANRRRRYEQVVPEGFVVTGDAATMLNPNYATGMSIAAFCALAMRRVLRRDGPGHGFARRAQRGIAAASLGSWRSATANDRWFPGTESTFRQGAGTGAMRFAAKWTRIAAEDPVVASATYDVASLRVPQSAMLTPALMARVLRGPRKPDLVPPDAIAQFPAVAAVLTARQRVDTP